MTSEEAYCRGMLIYVVLIVFSLAGLAYSVAAKIDLKEQQCNQPAE